MPPPPPPFHCRYDSKQIYFNSQSNDVGDHAAPFQDGSTFFASKARMLIVIGWSEHHQCA
jgi:hypothetical protein